MVAGKWAISSTAFIWRLGRCLGGESAASSDTQPGLQFSTAFLLFFQGGSCPASILPPIPHSAFTLPHQAFTSPGFLTLPTHPHTPTPAAALSLHFMSSEQSLPTLTGLTPVPHVVTHLSSSNQHSVVTVSQMQGDTLIAALCTASVT